jgi:hypothetical protein
MSAAAWVAAGAESVPAALQYTSFAEFAWRDSDVFRHFLS